MAPAHSRPRLSPDQDIDNGRLMAAAVRFRLRFKGSPTLVRLPRRPRSSGTHMLGPPRDASDTLRGLRGWLVLPDANDSPPRRPKRVVNATVPSDGAGQLGAPVMSVRLRRRSMFRTSMPKAPIHVHGNQRAGKQNVGPSAYPVHDQRPGPAEPKTCSVQGRAET